jgi:hypothetical protein
MCLLAVALTAACGGGSNPSAPSDAIPTPVPVPTPVAETVFVGAGDVGWPNSTVQKKTGRIVSEEVQRGAIPFVAGDAEQSDGAYENYLINYDPYWNPPDFPFKHLTLAVSGNHDYHDYRMPGADGFFRYFGAAADPDGTKTGWFVKRYPFATFIALNSNVDTGRNSAQLNWLRSVLPTITTPCAVAVWHHPRWSSGRNGDNAHVQTFWDTLYPTVDLVVHGHDHLIERMKPMRPDGAVDIARGIRQFTAGGGGAVLYELKKKHPNSEFFLPAHSVIRLAFRERSYSWRYIGLDGGTIDSDLNVPDNEKQCH